jgi:hypothetical protein
MRVTLVGAILIFVMVIVAVLIIHSLLDENRNGSESNKAQ